MSPPRLARSHAPSKCIRGAIASPRILCVHHTRPLSSHSVHHHLSSISDIPRKRRRRIVTPSSMPMQPFSTTTSFCSSHLHDPPSSSAAHTEPRPSPPFFHWPTSPNPSAYEIFHLPRTASTKEIKARYTLLVKQYHPDHAPHGPVDRFRKVVEAYKILSQPQTRTEYDRAHPASPSEKGPTAFSEFRRPWSGSRFTRRKTEHKGPPPSGAWSYSHAGRASRAGGFSRPDYSKWTGEAGSADNAHFNYEKYYARQMAQEEKLKRRMDVLHAHRVAEARAKESARSNRRVGMVFTGGLFLILWMIATSVREGM